MPTKSGWSELHRRLLALTAFRIAVITALLVTTAVFAVSDRGDLPMAVGRWLFGISVAAYGLILVCALALRWRTPLSIVASAQVAGDVLIAVAVVYLTGGASSIFVFMFPLAVVNASVLFFRRGAFVAATLSALGFGFIAVLLNTRTLQPPASSLALAPVPASDLALSMLANVSAFYLTAVLASYLAEQLRSTRQRLSEREADYAALEGLHSHIVESVSSGIATGDAANRLTYLNPAGEQILGRPLSELRGKQMKEVFGFAFDRKQADTARGEVRVMTPGGVRRDLGYSVSSLQRGGPGIVVAFQDLSSIHAMEEAMRRTERLSSLGGMAAGLAHEVRNPVGAMVGAIGLLSASRIGTEDQRLLDILRREADRLNRLVADFLAFARPGVAIENHLQLAPFLADVVEMFKHDPAASGADIAQDLQPVCVLGDAEALRGAILNLLINAAQAIEGNGGRIVVSARGEGDRAVIQVSDNGKGIPEADLPHVFDPFFSTKEHGTGLGLALAHSAVQSVGGTISVESRVGQGSTFTIRLRRDEVSRSGMAAVSS
jgi:two-component system, NtrC family, sensor histidine kinase PilS